VKHLRKPDRIVLDFTKSGRKKVVSWETPEQADFVAINLKERRSKKQEEGGLSMDLLLVLGAHSNSMAVTRNASVLVARVVVAWRFTLKHLTVLWDTVTLALGNGMLAVHGLALGWGPCKVVTTNLNVVVCELAELIVVHTEELSLFCCAELEAGDLVDDESEDGANGEGVGGDGDNVRNLLVDGLGGTGDGTACNTVVYTVESNDVVCTKNAVEEESNHTGDSVLSEHIEGIVNLDPELDCKMVSIIKTESRRWKNLLFVLKLQIIPVAMPRTTLAQGVMKPEAGVAATRPEMAPEHHPTMDHLRARRQSRRTQVMAANMAVKLLFQQAMTARRLAPKAEPPLKPSQPNHRNTVPRVIKETL
jgi:hypothetical protein